MTIRLRPYQKPMFAALKAAMKSDNLRSSYYAGTGSGKTVIYQKHMQDMFKSKKSKRVLVVHPTLALSSDQQDRFKKIGFDVPFTSFHSGNVQQSSNKVRNRSTTNRDELARILEDTKNEHHIVFTSYKSLSRIADMDWDLVVCDEAHNILSRGARDALALLHSRTVFFTATPVMPDNDEAMSMSDVALFGTNDADSNISPAELIKLEKQVLPRIIWADVTTTGGGDDDTSEDLLATLGLTYKDQRDNWVDPSLNHKMLAALPNTLRFSDIEQGVFEIRQHAGDMSIDVYTVTGEYQRKNGSEGEVFKTRESLLADFADNKNPCIIVHCDTLAEGIDIDDLTGAFVARGLSRTKFIQTLGRPTRPLVDDLDNNRKGDKRLKSIAPIHLARIDGDNKNGKVKEVDGSTAL